MNNVKNTSQNNQKLSVRRVGGCVYFITWEHTAESRLVFKSLNTVPKSRGPLVGKCV